MKYQKQISENKLRAIREAQGLRQQDVAKMLGFKITDRISKWEKGRGLPSLTNLFRLCVFYHVTPRELYENLFETLHEEAAEKRRKLMFKESE